MGRNNRNSGSQTVAATPTTPAATSAVDATATNATDTIAGDRADVVTTVAGGEGKDSIGAGAGEDGAANATDTVAGDGADGVTTVVGGEGQDSIGAGAGEDGAANATDTVAGDGADGVTTVAGGEGQDSIGAGAGEDGATIETDVNRLGMKLGADEDADGVAADTTLAAGVDTLVGEGGDGTVIPAAETETVDPAVIIGNDEPVVTEVVEVAPPKRKRKLRMAELDVPLAPIHGYASRDYHVSAVDAETLRDIAAGLEALGVTIDGAKIDNPQKALAWLLKHVRDDAAHSAEFEVEFA